MKKFKRSISMLLCFALVLGLSVVPAFAAAEDYEEDGVTPKTMAAIEEIHGIVEDDGTYATTAAGIVIDFNLELIYWADGSKPADDTQIPAFFTTDGTKWSAMKFEIAESKAAAEEAGPQKDFQKVLDKGATKLMFTTALGKDKNPQKAVKDTGTAAEPNNDAIDAATTYTWGAINARPKLAGFKPNFAPTSLKTVNAANIAAGGNGVWLPEQDKDPKQKAENLQIAYSTDGKEPLVGYGKIDVAKGVDVQGYDDKPSKVNYLIRVAPTAKSAASKAKKLSVSTVIKAPNLKVDYKKEIVKLKADMIWGTVELNTEFDLDEVADASQGSDWNDEEKNPIVTTSVKEFTAIANVKTTTKESAPVATGLKLEKDDANVATFKALVYGQDYGVRTVNTEKKPASKVQPISIAATGTPYEVDASLTVKGISVKLPKAYEAYDAVKKKWGASLKADKTGIYEIRLKNTAKYDAKTNTTSGDVTSGSMFLGVVVGKDSKDKAAITAYSYLATNGKTGEAEVGTASGAAEISVYPKTAADINKAITIVAASAEVGKSVLAATTDATLTIADIVNDGSATLTATSTSATLDGGIKFAFNAKTTTEATTLTAEFQVAADVEDADLKEKFYAPVFNLTVTPDNKKIVAAAKTAISAITIAGTVGTALDKTAVETAIETPSDAAIADGCTVKVEVATDTAMDKTSETKVAGKYTVTITISRGDEEQVITKSVTVAAE